MIEITQAIAPANTPCRPGILLLGVNYITIHNTANQSHGAGAKNHASYLQHGGKDNTVSWHFVIDDKDCYQCIPMHEVSYHCGNQTGNLQSLSIEICENPESDLTKATDRAAELTANLMATFGVGIADIRQHYDWSGKDCPRRLRHGEPYDWDEFIHRVEFYHRQTQDKLYRVQVGAFSSRERAENYAETLRKKGIQCFVKEE